MIYKAFAAVTLIAAPMIVLTVQSFVPQTNAPVVAPALSSPAPVVLPTVQPAPPSPMVNDPASGSASFGQPVPEAGKPSLVPGTGLPDTPPALQPPVGNPSLPPDEVPE